MASPLHRTRQIARHLSASVMSGATVPPAPWRAALISHIDAMESPTFVLSSIRREPYTDSAYSGQQGVEAPSASVPRARTVVYRDMLSITTDVRMDKVSEMLGHVFTAGPDAAETPQSHIGGPVEAVLWAAQAKTQWRVRGRVCMIGPDIESSTGLSVRQALGVHMRRQQRTGNEAAAVEADDAAATWGWATELTAHFGNLTPIMRGSFRNPPPGTAMSQIPDPGLGLAIGQTVGDLHDAIARRHFRVLVVIPEQVDQVDLSDPERGRRWRHDLVNTGNEAKWTTTELWP